MKRTYGQNSSLNFIVKGLAANIVMLLALLVSPSMGQNIHQIAYNGSWVDTNLTTTTGGPTPYVMGVSAFYTTPDNDLHVFYIATNRHIHQFTYKGVWADEDVTAESNGMIAADEVPVSAFTTNGAQYVYFCGNDNDLHEYAYGNNGKFSWVDTNVRNEAGGLNVTPCDELQDEGLVTVSFVAYATSNQRHVFLQAIEGSDIYHYVYKNSAWSLEDDTQIAGGETGDGSYMAGFEANGAQYVFFEGKDEEIHQLAYGAGGNFNWVDTNISELAKAPEGDPAREAGVAAFNVPGTAEIEVYYVTTETDKVEQLAFNEQGKWTKRTLAGQAPLLFGQMTALATTPNNQFHIYFNGDTKKPGIYQDYYNGSKWASQLLITDTPWIQFGGASSGFAMANSQYVYYVSSN